MNEENRKVPRRIAQTVLNSLKGGVVPRVGLPYITVGRIRLSSPRPSSPRFAPSRRASPCFA